VGSLGRAVGGRLLAAALLLGLSAQVAVQVTEQGLDLHVMSWAVPTAALAAGFVAAMLLSWRAVETGLLDSDEGLGRWGAAAIMPWLFLQLTLLANVGRLQQLAGTDVSGVGLIIGAGVFGAALLSQWQPGRRWVVLAALATVGLLVAGAQGGALTLLLVPAQAGLGLLLGSALAGPATDERAQRQRTHLAAFAGGMAFFVLLFAVYYDFADTLGVVAWPGAALIVALPGLRRIAASHDHGAPVLERVSVALLCILLVGAGSGAAASGPVIYVSDLPLRTPPRLTVVNYNIHQGIDRYGLPGLHRQLELISEQRPDIITLQEVNRAWNLAGGVDSFAWLSSRLPDYQAVNGPMHGIHFGNAIFVSGEHRVGERGHVRFALGESGLPRGFTWAEVHVHGRQSVLVTSAHLTAYERGSEDQERDRQAQELIDFWAGRSRATAIMAGD
jgi:hypothetical protein